MQIKFNKISAKNLRGIYAFDKSERIRAAFADLHSAKRRSLGRRYDVGLEISKSFLAKILQNLAREGILVSFKGANGGFMLAQKPEEISIKRIIESAEKRKMAVFECSISADSCASSKGGMCQIWPMFSVLQSKIDDFLDTITLANIIKK